MKKILILFFTVTILGCAQIGYKSFYNQVAPAKYPSTSNVMIFEYSNVDLDEIYNLLFSDFLIIGKSGFNGPYENPNQSLSYAKSIGADIFITSSQFKETRTSFMNLSTPTTNTTYISGYNGSGSIYGTATTYGTQTTTIPVRVNRYDQDGIYLKNINSVNPLWKRTSRHYKKTSDNSLTGIWENESYRIKIYPSGEQMVAFIEKIFDGDKSWHEGQLKMLFGKDSRTGIYLMGDKTPMPSKFSLNKFGHLEVKLLSNSETFSFAKLL